MKRYFALVLCLLQLPLFGYQVAVDTIVANPGQRVFVPVRFDTVKGAAYVGARLTYDAQTLILLKVSEGDLCKTLSDDFVVVADEKNGMVSVSAFGEGDVVGDVGGTLATLVFSVREGTQGQYSDVTVANVSIGDSTGVKDITIGNPITTRNGMVRVMSEDASVSRLEHAQTICADARLGSLTLLLGDAIQASDSQTPIVVNGAVGAGAVVSVRPPVNGWASGEYALLSTTSIGLQFALDGVAASNVVYSSSVSGGVITYFAKLALADEIPVDCPDEPLDSGTMNLIRCNAKLLFEGKNDAASKDKRLLYESAKKISVTGPKGLVSIVADMGISPAFPVMLDETGTLRLTYAQPKLEITGFNASTGAVRFKVTPGEGNEIVSEIATGYLHVYGADYLAEGMRYISKVGFDLTPYLKSDSKGEGVLKVTLGSHSFIKIKIESTHKVDGQIED